jgi:hypothetical protein
LFVERKWYQAVGVRFSKRVKHLESRNGFAVLIEGFGTAVGHEGRDRKKMYMPHSTIQFGDIVEYTPFVRVGIAERTGG